MLAIKLAFRNLLGAGLRTWLNVFVLSLSFVLIIYINGMLEGWNYQAKSDMKEWETGSSQYWQRSYDPYDPFTFDESFAPVPESFASQIDSGLVAPVLIRLASIYPEGRVQSVILKGISPQQTVLDLPTKQLDTDRSAIPAIIGKRMAAKNHLSVGDYVTLQWRDDDGTFDAREVLIVEIFNCNVPSVDAGQLWIPIDLMREMFQLSNVATILISNSSLDAEIPDSEWIFRDFDYLTEEVSKIIQSKSVGTSIFYVILLFLAMLAIFDTQVLSIFRRQKEIGTQIALGMTRGQLVRLFTIEGAMHAVLAAALGALYGIPLFLYSMKTGIPMPEGSDEYGLAITDSIIPVYTGALIAGTIVAVMVAATVVSYIPSRKIAKMKPTDAIRGKIQ